MHPRRSRRRFLACLPVLLCLSAAAGAPAPQSPAAGKPGRMDWFREARFGMFIHWGIYSVPAGEWDGKTNYAEWIMLQANIPVATYEQFAARFDPVKFDAREWARTAREAGMRYVVITAKHHDGFCMYDTRLTDYNIVKATPYGRDPMKDLAEACREAGLKLCFYYSIPDWHHPEFPAKYSQRGYHGRPNPDADLEKYVAYMKGQVRELLSNYGPVAILWFDGGGSFREAGNRPQLIRAQEIIDLAHRLQPDCLVNNRLGLPADYGTPEQKIPGEQPKEAFEVCMTLNKHWGYNSHDQEWKTPAELVFNLADIASKGGNYLLNVGPTSEGLIPQPSRDNLQAVGRWLKVNGEAIYGTGPTPFGRELGEASPTEKDAQGNPKFVARSDWRCTTRPGKLYIHLLRWPAGAFALESVPQPVSRAYLLADPARRPLPISRPGGGLRVSLPAVAPDALDSVLCLETGPGGGPG